MPFKMGEKKQTDEEWRWTEQKIDELLVRAVVHPQKEKVHNGSMWFVGPVHERTLIS